MFVEQALKRYLPGRPLAALDLCAAPGGKSTHVRSLLPEGSLLVANEVMRNRAQILAENLTKWGHPDVVVTNSDPSDFTPLEHLFDFILTDVPCSGEGMFRKDETAISEWSAENVEICWQRQRRILDIILQSDEWLYVNIADKFQGMLFGVISPNAVVFGNIDVQILFVFCGWDCSFAVMRNSPGGI